MYPRSAKRNAEGVERPTVRLPSVSRAGGMGLDRDSLSSMKVSELRALCKEKGLLVSGKKGELVSRLLGKEVTKKSPETKVASASLEHGKDDAIDRLLARFETGGAGMPEDEAPEPAVESEEVLEVEVIEAEIVEAEIEPEAEEELEIVLDGEEEEPTLEVEPEILLDDDDDPWGRDDPWAANKSTSRQIGSRTSTGKRTKIK